jgi:hypothetical protein
LPGPGTDAHQRRLRLQGLEVDANRQHVGNALAIVEFEHRDGAIHIDGAECRTKLLVRPQIHLDRRQCDALFRQEDAHAPRIRRRGAIMQLHRAGSGS